MKELALVGGGHAHVQVIRRWMMRPIPDVRLSVVLDRAEALYSGMVPGLVAGDYAAPELEIDVVPLARRARARLIQAAALRVDPQAGRIELEGRPPLFYDVASLDVGSSVRGLELPGVRDHALATRPIRSFVDRLDARLAATSPSATAPVRLAVVGGGAAGLELAFTLRSRFLRLGQEAELCVVTDSARVLPGHPGQVARRACQEAERRGIRILPDARVERVDKDAIHVAGERIACDLAVWATGAAPPPLIAASPLPRDEAGFVPVNDDFRVVGHDELFAVGDCASLDAHPWVPKAGVYAVRAGPVLDANLRAHLSGGRLRSYRPQRDFLALLNLGGGEALGAKWGVVATGRRVFRLKDWIDRRFMRRFQVLDAVGRPAPAFPSPEQMGMEAMECGGCAAKLDAESLERALARVGPPPSDPSVLLGLDRPDDAAALRLSDGEVLLATVDAFRAFTDDPWLVGRVAAVNAASDVLAKGGRPRHALALVNVPATDRREAEETLFQVLSGIRAGLEPLGVSLVGGHTTSTGDDLVVGLSVTGNLEDGPLLRQDGAGVGEALVLTKALGTGVVLAADMQGLARGAWVASAHASMLRPNLEAVQVARGFGASASTDVSGFGLAFHLGSLLRASGLAAEIDLDALPALDGATDLLARGLRSTFHAQNVAAAGDQVRAPASERSELLFDPQTSGGLLFSLPADRARDAVAALREAGDGAAAVIGRLIPAESGTPRIRAS